jgi:hypothetical protein
MELRVEEDGASERCSVMEQIKVEAFKTTSPCRENGQTSIWSFITRELD